MKDAKVYAIAAELEGKIRTIVTNQQTLGQNTIQMINQMKNDVLSISIYVEGRREYEEKYWMLPIAVFPGKKIFKKIYDRKVDEINKAREAYIAKQKALQEAAIEKALKEKKDENKKV